MFNQASWSCGPTLPPPFPLLLPLQAFKQAPWTVVLLGAMPVFAEGFLDSLIFTKVRR